jgi:hypothetical protein
MTDDSCQTVSSTYYIFKFGKKITGQWKTGTGKKKKILHREQDQSRVKRKENKDVELEPRNFE